MTIPLRSLNVLPEKLIVSDGGLRAVENTAKQINKIPFLFAYRKTSGADQRVRIVSMQRNIISNLPDIALYHLCGSKKLETVQPGSSLVIMPAFGRSQSLSEEWLKALPSYVEGGSYSLSRYAFTILSAAEHQALTSSLLVEDWTSKRENFKY